MDKGLMNDATSTDDSPTSGYQLSEIARATKSSYQANTQIQQYLTERLSKSNHNTKYKTLMIIKHVCRTGRPEFKREMGKSVDAIKECLQFKGPPDPLRGDEIYRRVRECAKEVLEALFDGQAPVSTSAVAAAGRVQGFGSDYVPSEGSGKPAGTTGAYFSSVVSSLQSSVLGDSTDARYAGHPGATSSFGPTGSAGGGFGNTSNAGGSSGGFGNPNFQDPRNEKSWLERASQMAGFSKTDTREPLQSGGGFSGNNTHSSGTFNRAAFSNNPGPVTNSGYSYATNRGPNGIHATTSPYAPSGPYGQQQVNPSANHGIVPEMPPNTSGFGRAGGAMSNGEYEKNLIVSLCEPGGLRPVPAEDKLVELLNTASTLSEDILGNCLLDVLNDEAWQSRTKALIVVARLVQMPGCAAHAQWWAEHADVVESLQSDPKAGVRTQAVKTLKAIDPSAAVGASTSAGQPRRVSSGRAWTGTGAAGEEAVGVVESESGRRELNLLDMDDLTPSATVAAQNPVANAPSAAPYGPPSVSSGMSPLSQDDGLNLFGPGMTLSAASTPSAMAAPPTMPQQQYSQPPSVFGGAATASSSSPASASLLDTDSMFAGMSVGPTLSAAPVPAPVPASTTTATAFDFLNTGTSPAPAVNHSADIDLFGSLTLSNHAMPVPAPAPTPAASSSQMHQGGNFGGLLDLNTPNSSNSVPAGTGLPAMSPQQHQQFMQYQQFLLHQQHQQGQGQGQGQPHGQYVPAPQQGAPGAHPNNNNIGMYLTRPVPGMGATPGSAPPQHGQPVYGQPHHAAHPGHVNHHHTQQGSNHMVYPPGAPGTIPGAPRGSPHQPSIQVRQGASVIAPGMLSHTAERKNIPVAGTAAGSSSAFGFMGGPQQPPGGQSAGGIDSFSFVTDAMRSQK